KLGNELQASDIPLLASPPRSASATARRLRERGVAASSRKFREATEAVAAGVVFLFVLIGKPPRPRCQWMLRDMFLLARPPLVLLGVAPSRLRSAAVMQGGECRSLEPLSRLV